jgi:hypothetical protein
MSKNRMIKYFSIFAICAGLAACGGGGGGSTGSNTSGSTGGTDPSAPTTTPGAGSTVSNAETTQGTIRYSQYQTSSNMMSTKGFTVPTVSANIAYNATSKQGSIQFPIMGANELITTNDAYATTQWTGPFMSGSYKFNGNILVGCNSSAPTVNEQTQIFVSSNLTRVQNGFIDDMNGQTFDLYDCSMLQSSQVGSLKINTDGSLFISTANYTFPKNQVFDMLNPETYPGALINNGNPSTSGFYSGHAFKYGANGVTKYAIVIQTSAGNMTTSASYHYLLAVQR